jgi:hypothetical protein
VFFQQIADLASYSADYTQRRNELYKQFKPIIEAAGVSVGANEVMQTEYQRASGQFTSSVKSMAGDLVTLVPNVMIAAQHQNRLLDKQPFTFSFGKKTEEAPVKTEAQLAAEWSKVHVGCQPTPMRDLPFDPDSQLAQRRKKKKE